MRNFYPRSPCGERRAVSITGYLWSYFYPRSPCGERPEADIQDRIAEKFLSTLSLRRATRAFSCKGGDKTYFYPRSPCGERPVIGYMASFEYLFLSTLSLRRATERQQKLYSQLIISIHALLAESDNKVVILNEIWCTFLSTLSLRRATLRWIFAGRNIKNFYPRSPCGERRSGRSNSSGIQIFLSTLSLRRATTARIIDPTYGKISIHALLAESDCSEGTMATSAGTFLSTLSLRRATEYWVGGYGTANNFYPRSPCGERLLPLFWHLLFQKISIHALLAESDPLLWRATRKPRLFLSTLSLRRATIGSYSLFAATGAISIHALLAESDKLEKYGVKMQGLFLSTLSLRRATAKVHKTVGHFCAYETNFMGIASSC